MFTFPCHLPKLNMSNDNDVKKMPIEKADFYIIKQDIENAFKKSGIL